MKLIKNLLILLLLLTVENLAIPNNYLNEATKIAKLVFNKCWAIGLRESRDYPVPGLTRCLKRTSLQAMDKLIAQDTISMPYGVTLVKTGNATRNSRYNAKLHEVEDWKTLVIGKVGEMLRTHNFKFSLVTTEIVEGRRRRNQHNMMPLMLFGVMAMAIIAIPLGFQFLAVLGGKALLLAKLALILTSIQGLKKIAVSDVNYGLYHTGGHHHLHHEKPGWLYDRRWQNAATGHHSYDGYDVPDQNVDALYHVRPRISNRAGNPN